MNKLILQKNLYNLRIKDGDSVTKHLNAFNIVVSQLLSVDIKILDEDKCINLLCSLPDSWDSLVVATGNNTITLKFDEIVSSLLLEEMRQKIRRARMEMPCLCEGSPGTKTKISP